MIGGYVHERPKNDKKELEINFIAHLTSYQMDTRDISSGVKRPGRGAIFLPHLVPK
jgi:hypothetical protein